MKSASFAIIFLLLSWSASSSQQHLVINEFMAENDNFLIDPTDNSFDDWIEIYNGSSNSIHLANFFLTDNPSLPTKWPFPDITIAPGAFQLVWADEDSGDSRLHAKFKLNKAGEFLGLYHQSGSETIAIDTLSFGPQTADVSFGRFPDGSSDWQSLTSPTPGASNRIS